jgi:benzoyl-CoA 2,3-epoxidase subunit B
MGNISTFTDWLDLLREWQNDVGLDAALIERYRPGYQLNAKYAELPTSEIYFGDLKGERRWEKALQIPDQPMRDVLLRMIVVQGDTEFASYEQHRSLVDTAPYESDLAAIVRVMVDETRHGFQICHLLVNHFGDEGKTEAQKLLERRAFGKKDRLLLACNDDIRHWLDFYAYTNFMDRVGKFQLAMLSHSAFAPLAQSTGPMLREESFHMGTGITGLRRIAQANVIPASLQQKYYNKWISGSLDLFGIDQSDFARRAYTWGLKGRVDENRTDKLADKEHLNERARLQFYDECKKTIDYVNAVNPAEDKLYMPDIRFNRKIGAYAGQHWSVSGQKLTLQEWQAHASAALPDARDEELLKEYFKVPSWIAPKRSSEAGY